MAAKTSLSDPATKADIKKLHIGNKTLRGEILRVEERVENLEEGQKRMETTLNKISNQLDGFVGRVDDLTNDNEVGSEQIRRLDEKVTNHEERITKLETLN